MNQILTRLALALFTLAFALSQNFADGWSIALGVLAWAAFGANLVALVIDLIRWRKQRGNAELRE